MAWSIVMLFAWGWLCRPIALVIHEMGHALMALAVRFRVFRIQLGIGDELFSFHFGSTTVSFGRSYGGRVWAAPSTLNGWKWRKALITIAGPGLCAIVGVLAIVFGLTFVGPAMVKAGSVLFGFVNIFHLRSFIPNDERPTDGGNLLIALRATPEVVHTTATAAMAEEVEQLLERGHPSALKRAKKYFELASDRPDAGISLAGALAQAGEFAEAKTLFERGLKAFSEFADVNELDNDQRAEATEAIRDAIEMCDTELAKATSKPP